MGAAGVCEGVAKGGRGGFEDDARMGEKGVRWDELVCLAVRMLRRKRQSDLRINLWTTGLLD